MRKLFLIVGLFTILSSLFVPIFGGNIIKLKPHIDRVYRSDKISGYYHFLLLDGDRFYYINTNRTDNLTADEIKSSDIMDILRSKQSWGEEFLISDKYFSKNGRLLTKSLDIIRVKSPKKIEYLNKTFTLQ